MPAISENEQPERRASGDLETGAQSAEEASDKMVYFTELIIFGNERECLLVDGEYELVLHDKGNGKQRKRKQLSWETDYNGKVGRVDINIHHCAYQIRPASIINVLLYS